MLKHTPMTRWNIMLVALLMLGGTTSAMADDLVDCEQEADRDVQIQGCTSLIESETLSGNGLAAAYYNRGNAFGFSGDFDRAIADYSAAIEIKPDFALAYGNRAIAYRVKGDPERAKPDCDIATGLNPDINC